jgi:uncharacterized protein (UPF0264 family)
MTRLLVSVRSLVECLTALQSSAEIIDIKEPERGSLGLADPATIQQIVEAVRGRRPVSVALGELCDLDTRMLDHLPEVQYVKVGLSGCACVADWRQRWNDVWQRVPVHAERVAVAYADAEVARSPHWSDVLSAGHESRCSVFLVDTFDKSAGGLLRWFDMDTLREIRARTDACGMQLALAGSLNRQQIVEILDVHPNFVAVRTAVCGGRRNARLSRTCIDEIVNDMRGFSCAKK